MLETSPKKGILFRNFILDFLIADYSSWRFLDISYLKKAKAGDEPEKVMKGYLPKRGLSAR